MKKRIYQTYLEDIQKVMNKGRLRKDRLEKGVIVEGRSQLSGPPSDKITFMSKEHDERLFSTLTPLSAITGNKAKYHEKPGAHPDFQSVKDELTVEYHAITTMFIDIRNSTNLFKKYEPMAVAEITNLIQRAAVHTCWQFDGYIQRFHGDGLMVYFGGKSKTVQESAESAINAASFIAHFITHDLKNIFYENGVEDITIRIGIDTGYNEAVLWHLAGMGECSEVTTCSLHTSLASKMQSNADTNGIMLGQYVKDNLTISGDLFSIKKDSNNNELRYIFRIPEEDFYYTQWRFNWSKYLKDKSKLSIDENGYLYLIQEEEVQKPVVHTDKNLNYLREQTSGYKPYYQ